MSRLVFCDLDGTLLAGVSSEQRFILWLLRRGILGPKQLLAHTLFPLRYVRRYGRDVLKKNKGYLHGKRTEDIAALGRQFVREHLASSLYQPCVERMRMHREAGDVVVLLTGSPDFLAQPLGARVQSSRVHATICATEGKCFIARPPVQHPLAFSKAEIAHQIAADTGLPLRTSVAYADSRFDLPLLEIVETPVAVQPDSMLRAIAASRGWEIIDGDVEPHTEARDATDSSPAKPAGTTEHIG